MICSSSGSYVGGISIGYVLLSKKVYAWHHQHVFLPMQERDDVVSHPVSV